MGKKKEKSIKARQTHKQKLKRHHRIMTKFKTITKYLSKICDKYLVIIISITPSILLIPTFLISLYGLITNKLNNPWVWGSISYVVLYVIKSMLTSLLFNSSYSKNIKFITQIIKLIFLIMIAPIFMAIIPNIFKDVNSYVLLTIPFIYFFIFKFCTCILPIIISAKGITIKSYKIVNFSLLIIILFHISILICVFRNLFSYKELCFIYDFNPNGIIQFVILSLISNITMLILHINKKKAISNWRTIKINSRIFRYKHINGVVNQIYEEKFMGVFIILPKYENYRKLNDFSIGTKWLKFSKKLFWQSPPNDIDMMINDEFSSNVLFRLYYITKKWPIVLARLYRVSYAVLGILFSLRGIYFLYQANDYLDSFILIFVGVHFIWVSIYGYIIHIAMANDTNKRNSVLMLSLIVFFHIAHVVIFFSVYKKVLVLNIILFLYFLSMFKYMKKYVIKDKKYDYFDMKY